MTTTKAAITTTVVTTSRVAVTEARVVTVETEVARAATPSAVTVASPLVVVTDRRRPSVASACADGLSELKRMGKCMGWKILRDIGKTILVLEIKNEIVN